MTDLTRRSFVRLLAGSALFSTLGACVPGGNTPTAPPRPGVAPTPTPALSPAPSPTTSRAILRNDNVPGFYVRYYKPFQAVDPERWTLTVDGLVNNPQHLPLTGVLGLPRAAQVSRMKCVECWSAAAQWEGFHLRSLLELVKPSPEAKWLNLTCADGYYESMKLETLLQERVIFVHHMNDQILPDIYGAPLRLMVPFRYGYKSAKAIQHLEFARVEGKGYWSTVAPYTSHGEIQKGTDHPLDLEGNRQIEGGTEIFYPDGFESQS